MFEADQGLSCAHWEQPVDWQGPWRRATHHRDRRLFPKRGGGRRFRHPFLDPIVYPRMPDKTVGFDQTALLRVKSVVTKTLDSSVVSKFRDKEEDPTITEMWAAGTLSTEAGFFRALHKYLLTPLPVGRYIGWQPRDGSWKSFFIELLDVQLGQDNDYNLEELGDARPYLMRESLTVRFKLVREIIAPVSSVVVTG